MPSTNQTGSCLTCVHFERMFSVCKFDYPRGFGPKAVRCTQPPRVTRTTDIRTFRCGDYLNWESGLLPFNKQPQDDAAAEPVKSATG